MPIRPAPFGMPVTPEQAALMLRPFGDATVLRDLVTVLGVPEVKPGQWDYADLSGLHLAVSPWRARKDATKS